MNSKAKRHAAVLCLLAAFAVNTLSAAEGPSPKGIPNLDRVFLIMMENHGYSQILNNPNAPYINQMVKSANSAANYFAIGHPSLTNYLEVVGGSNFGVLSDNNPIWGSSSCITNLASGTASTDNPATADICQIWGTGRDAATTATDCTNEVTSPPCENNIDGVQSIAAATNTAGKTIADQLVASGYGKQHSWKSYQESLPVTGAYKVNYSDGLFTDSTNFTTIHPTLNPPLSQDDVVKLYAVKHNPFAYFRSVQEGHDQRNSLKNIVGFDGPGGLFDDLGSGDVPALSFIAPNQCNDQHGRGNAGSFCNYDPVSDGSQTGLNPALISLGDVAVQRIVTAIKGSDAWKQGRNAIIVMWDENDYSTAPNTNQVLVIVDTNYGSHGVKSTQPYNHFSLLKSIESGFGLPCLNHACDSNVNVMSDLFGGSQGESTDRTEQH